MTYTIHSKQIFLHVVFPKSLPNIKTFLTHKDWTEYSSSFGVSYIVHVLLKKNT